MFSNLSDRSRDMLPPLLAEELSQEDITKFSLRLNNDPGNPSTATVRVEWNGKDNSLVQKWVDIGRMKNGGQDILSCDGPCGQELSVLELHHFGRCEHNVCSQCLSVAPRDVVFRTRACPNVDCMIADLVEKTVTEQSHVSLNTDFSRSTLSHSNTGIKELILVKMVVFEKKGRQATRKKTTTEWYNSTPLKEVYRRIAALSSLELTSLSCCPGTLYSRYQLKPLPQDSHRLSDLVGPSDDTEIIFFAGFGGAVL